MISSDVTDRAPWRRAVPRQSAPVSPPPMTMTSLPVEAHGEQDELSRDLPLGALDLDEALVAQLDVDQPQGPNLAEIVAQNLLGAHRVDPFPTLFVCPRNTEECGVCL